MFGLSDKTIRLIKQTLVEYPAIQEALIFGSRAMGNHKKGSDVDMALKGQIDFDLVAKIQYRFNEELPLPYFFDIVNYNDISNPDFKKHIDQFGKVFFAKDSNAA